MDRDGSTVPFLLLKEDEEEAPGDQDQIPPTGQIRKFAECGSSQTLKSLLRIGSHQFLNSLLEEDEFSKLQTKNILGQVLKDNFDTYFDDISPEKEVYELANDTILNKSEEKNKKFNAPNYKAEQIFLQNSLSAAATLGYLGVIPIWVNMG